MTQQSEVIDDPKYLPVLDHGFVGIVEVMGGDHSIVQGARVSYGAGTKAVSQDRGLIRYLMRMRHTSPFELTAIKLHIKAPIFVLRQLYRHRTHSANEMSLRYSVAEDEFYVPEFDIIQPQSDDNKQGRSGSVSDGSKTGVRWLLQAVFDHAYDVYQTLLGERDPEKFMQGDVPYAAYDEEDGLLDKDFHGIARELARTVLPVANYSELYWQQNLHNLFHLLKLRTDDHAQYEIRAYANAICKLVEPYFPVAFEAFHDFIKEAQTFSRMEMNLLRDLLKNNESYLGVLEDNANNKSIVCDKYGLSKRELKEFMDKIS